MTVSDGIETYEKAHDQQCDNFSDICIEDHIDLVKRIAQHMIVRMPASVQVEDLIQSGMIGLIEASRKYDPSRGASFDTYAGIRIRGSIVDEIRKGDWVPRSVHRNTRRITDTINQLEAQLGRDAKDSEIAKAMNVDLEEYYSMSRDAVSGHLFSIDESFAEEELQIVNNEVNSLFTAPYENTQKESLRLSLTEAIKNLPEREQLVLSLYYDDELNLKEIGHILGVSESRVSQIHSQAALKLRSKLKEWL